MKKIIICDLDGTLADCSHRLHFVQGPDKKNWKAFFNAMSGDLVAAELNEILQVLHQFYDVYFVSARPDDYRTQSVDWLSEAGWDMSGEGVKLIMRKEGDYRADTIVKKEILDQIRNENVRIVMAFDDRKSVVDMWRENGVFTAQVQDHDF